jgi:NADPH:quinone reductase-like Zn-dependent oxidoreductase
MRKGQVTSVHHVLVVGPAGGVGVFAVQLAKALGADVTGVCSMKNLDLVRSLGADHAVDYTKEDFTRGGPRYDVILDMTGNRTSECVGGGITTLNPHPTKSGWLDLTAA